jgi:glucose-6-phosphate 1-dehydrogenase
MEFHYAEDFGPQAIPEAYERLLLDALNGDASLYMRADGIEIGWALVDPIQRSWDTGAPKLHRYTGGSWGPSAAVEFLGMDNRGWAMGCGDGSSHVARDDRLPAEATIVRKDPRHA